MYIIGVTGGVGAGKSEVLRYLEEAYGARIIKLDDVARALQEVGGACYDGMRELFGEGALLPDGSLDRAAIAKRVFADADLKEKLNTLIHPAVKEETGRLIRSAQSEGCALLVLEAALLIEEHYDAFTDEMWYIYADEATRYSRLIDSRGYSRERIRNMMKSQLTEEQFRAASQTVIDNSGSFAETKKQIDARIGEIAPAAGRSSAC
ncbi:MAG: dephospho-CoA kinase, partial [Lachnospiraceae bacterium]|nr:dephospho-CoA kinase [Lachnospiraceae bacterium]